MLQPLGQRHVGGRVDPGRRHEPADALLREVLRADTVVARPFVGRSGGIVVDRHERELVQPRCDVAVRRDVARRRARAERDAQDRVPPSDIDRRAP